MSTHEEAYLFALRMANQAREIALGHYGTEGATEVKADRSLVTAADRAIEEMVRNECRAKGYGIRGEEFGDENAGAEYLVIIDPIDGTNHFVTRDGNFFTLIGIHHKKEGFVVGICDQPTVTDGFWTGVKGFGAARHKKTEKGEYNLLRMLSGSRCTFVSDAILTSYNPHSLTGPEKFFYEDVANAAKASVSGGDAGNYARMAEGRVHIVLETVGGIYDLAALIPMLSETGAVVKRLTPDGKAFDLSPDDEGRMTILAAATPELMQNLLDMRSRNFSLYKHYDQKMQEIRNSGT